MEDIIKLVAKKAGISEPIAKIAVESVIAILKNKLPGAIGSQLDAFLGTSSKTTSSKTTASSTKKGTKTITKATKKATTKTAAKPTDKLGDITNIIGGISGLFGKK